MDMFDSICETNEEYAHLKRQIKECENRVSYCKTELANRIADLNFTKNNPSEFDDGEWYRVIEEGEFCVEDAEEELGQEEIELESLNEELLRFQEGNRGILL